MPDAESTPNGSRDSCDCDSSDFPCWECYRTGRRDIDGNHIATDGGARVGESIGDLTDLREGDRVLWNDRKQPLVVRKTTFGSHVMVEGPNGAIYRVQPDPRGGFRLGHRGGNIAAFRRVERVDDASDEADVEADRPGGRGG